MEQKDIYKYLKRLKTVFEHANIKTHLKRVEQLLITFPKDDLPKHLERSIRIYYNTIQKDASSIKLLNHQKKILEYADAKLSCNNGLKMKGGNRRAAKKANDDTMSDSNESDLLPHLQKFLSDKHDNNKTQ